MKQAYQKSILLLSALWYSLLNAQPSGPFCGSDLLLQSAMNQPVFQQKHEILEKQIYDFFKKKSGAEQGLMVVTLPVVVHIVHDGGPENISDAQVLTGIQQLNEAFANAGYYDQSTGANTMIQFCLARRTPDGLATNGITRNQSTLTDMSMDADDIALKDLNRWPPKEYVNIWLVREICSSGSGCGVAGYAYFPSSHGNPEDGIVMEAEYMGSTPGNTGVLAHEMGHYLGLYHTFQGGCQNDDCLADGDRVCDTPPDQSTLWVPCNLTVNTCSTDAQSGFSTDQLDMIQNFMDYTDFNCFHDFTMGQSDRMHWYIDNVRLSLTNSKACLDPCPTPLNAFFTPSALEIDAGQTVNFTNGSANASSYEWSVNGMPFSTALNTSYLFTAEGYFTVLLRATSANTALCGSDTFTVQIKVNCPVDANFTVSNLHPGAGETVTITNTSQNATQYEWFLNGNSQGSAFTGFTPALPGVYAVRLTASNGACTATRIAYIAVSNPDEDCQDTWIKTAGLPNLLEGGANIIAAADGNFYLSGFRGDTTLLMKMTPDGLLLWTRSIKFSGGFNERVTCLIEDSDGMLVGAGFFEAGPFGIFLFRYNPAADQVLWNTESSVVPQSFVFSILEKAAGGNYLFFNSYHNSPSPGSNDDANLVEVNRNTGQIMSLSTAYSFGSSESVLEARIRNDKIYTCGRYTYGSNYGGMRCALSCFDLQGNPQWARMMLRPDGVEARIYANDFCFDGDTMVTICYGDFAGDDPVTNEFAICKTDLNGVLAWSRRYTVPGAQQLLTKSIVYTADGYIVMVSDISGTKGVYLVKTDKTGAIQWSRHFPGFQLIRGEKTLAVSGDYLYFTAERQNDIVLAKVNLSDGLVGGNCNLPQTVNISSQILPPVSIPITLIQYPGQTSTGLRTTFPQARTLTAANLCFQPCTQEDCTNGIDDDGDNKVDCLDDDCDCTPCDGEQARIWYFGNGAGLDFATNPPTLLTDGQTFSREASAVANDPMGNLLFYTDGQQIYNRNHQIMPNGGGLSGHPSTTQALILPQPGQPWRFFVFTPNSFDNLGSGAGLSYSVVDMSLQGTLGDVVSGQKNIELAPQAQFTEKISATRHCNGTDWWIVTKERNNNRFRAWLLSAGGLSAPVLSDVGTPGTTMLPNAIGVLKFSPDGRTMINTLFQSGGVDLFDFDNSTGILSNARTITTSGLNGAYGAEFSPAGRYLYISNLAAPARIWQFDLQAGSTAAIQASGFQVASFSDQYRFGQLQRAPDNKIYVTNTFPLLFTPGLGIIHQPENAGAACQYQQDGLILTPGGANLGLPSFPQDFFPRKIFPLISGPDTLCSLPDTVVYTLNTICGVDTVIWSLSGPATLLDKNSQQAGIKINAPGEILLSATVFTPCAIAADTQRITLLAPAPVLDLGPDITTCDNGVQILRAGPGFEKYRWSDAGSDSTLTTLFPGTYWVDVWDACGNKQSDTVVISVLPPTVLDLGPDISSCAGVLYSFTLPAGFTGWTWMPEDGLDCDDCPVVTATINNSTTYIVIARTAENCLSADTLTLLASLDTTSRTIDTIICTDAVLNIYGLALSADTSVQILIQNPNSCDSLITINVMGSDPVNLSQEIRFCPGDTVDLHGILFSADTTVQVILPAAGGCDTILTVQSVLYPPLLVNLPATDTLVIGDTLQLQVQVEGAGPFQFTWMPAPPPDWLSCYDCPDPVATPQEDIKFRVQVSDANGCSGAATVALRVLGCEEPFIPNAFTPNGDGVNDWFYIFGPECIREVRLLRIYSRWGELVFERYNFPANQSSLGWDGRFHGKDFPTDVLVFFAEIEMPDGKVLVKTGDVTLIR